MPVTYNTVDLKVSDEAAKALEGDLQQLAYDAVAAILRVLDPMTSTLLWEVGFFRRGDVPPEGIQEIRGIPFVFNQGPVSASLNGTTLHKNDGGYVVLNADSAHQ